MAATWMPSVASMKMASGMNRDKLPPGGLVHPIDWLLPNSGDAAFYCPSNIETLSDWQLNSDKVHYVHVPSNSK